MIRLALLFLLWALPAWGQSVSASPSAPSIACNLSPGSAVSTTTAAGFPAGITTSTWTASGDTTDFRIGNPSVNSAQIVVGTGGISNCNSTQSFIATVIQPSGPPPPGVAVPFSLPTGDVLHYISPTGNDSNNGTTPGTSWLTPNHPLHCGDVIIAAAGSYTNQFNQNWGTVTSCPSTTGGIDGAGGIYFAILLCGGVDLEACQDSGGFELDTVNYWAIEGFKCNGGGSNRCFEEKNCNAGVITHHGAFINNISINAADGFDMVNDCGDPSHSPTGSTFDYGAGVGNIAQNSSQDPICLAAIDWIALGNFDTNPGTHAYVYGNFAWNNVSPSCVSSFDSESYMLDTLDAHNFNGQIVVANNISWKAMRYGLQVFNQHFNANHPTVKIYNNTFYADLSNTGGDFADGDYNFNGGGATSTWPTTLQRNIGLTAAATSGTGTAVFTSLIGGGVWSAFTNGGAGNENVLKGQRTDCDGMGQCDPGFNEASDVGNPLGTNFYENPLFTSTADLLSNHMGPPTCTGFMTTTACMGWNANTGTLTALTPISDLVANSAHSLGKGYQLPSTICAANADYPTWLKGIVYLHWNSATSTITENSGLVTKPCNM